MAIQPENPSFAAASFTSRDDSARRLVARALSIAPQRPGLRMLDLGCGTGAVAIEAACLRDDLQVVALDIAPANLGAARIAADRAGIGSRVNTVCADYLNFRGGPFDLIVSDSVLYIIPGEDSSLAARLAADLVLGGVLVITTPIESVANRIRIGLRRIWRALPLGVDKLAFVIARWFYPEFSPQALADRVKYLRVIPIRLYGTAFAEALRREGIEQILEEPWASASVAKLTHRLVALRRTSKSGISH